MLLLGLYALALPLAAEDSDSSDQLDTVVVTGSSIGYDDLLDTPAVSLTKTSDYLPQTIAKLIASARGRYVVFHLDEYRIALNRHSRTDLEQNGKRPDTNQVSLQVRVGICGDPGKAETLIAEMRRFR